LEVRDLGDGNVLILGRLRGIGKLSGVEISAPFAQIGHVDDGQVVVLRGYMTHDEAIAAAGLAA
jgi:hypothetical protein